MSKQRRRDLVKKPTKQPVLVLTGERMRRRVRVRFHGLDCWLTDASFAALVDLLIARAGPTEGFRPIGRLRSQLNVGRKDRMGYELIKTGNGEEYRLDIPRDRLRMDVIIGDGFFELVDRGVITPEQDRAIREIFKGGRRLK